jgi:hypothetical protein
MCNSAMESPPPDTATAIRSGTSPPDRDRPPETAPALPRPERQAAAASRSLTAQGLPRQVGIRCVNGAGKAAGHLGEGDAGIGHLPQIAQAPAPASAAIRRQTAVRLAGKGIEIGARRPGLIAQLTQRLAAQKAAS